MKSQRGKEREFKLSLGNFLFNEGIQVYYHEDFYPQFTVSNSHSYIDMYLAMPHNWIYYGVFPVLGVEIKTAESLGQLVKALDQLKNQRRDREESKYFIREIEIEVEAPVINLLVTPESFYRGNLYEWSADGVQSRSQEFNEGVWKGLTELYDRIIWKHNCAILRQNTFLYQQKLYDLTIKRGNAKEATQLRALLGSLTEKGEG